MPQALQSEALLELLRSAGPAPLGPERRANTLGTDALEQKLAPLLKGFAGEDAALIRSLLLLWHDHLDASHEISQGISGPDGSFVHGIMHRREPDYWNSKYWFRRVGNHAAFPEIAKRASQLPTSVPPVPFVLFPPWDPFAFVDAVESASSRSGTEAQRAFLREVQQIEFEVLLAHFAARA
jgi:hypothetical protein